MHEQEAPETAGEVVTPTGEPKDAATASLRAQNAAVQQQIAGKLAELAGLNAAGLSHSARPNRRARRAAAAHARKAR